jgi:hypothetical protein
MCCDKLGQGTNVTLIAKHKRNKGFCIHDVDEFSTQMENTP